MYLNDRVLDNGLQVLTNESTHLHLCTSEPASFAAVAGVSLGSKAFSGGAIGAPGVRAPSGRKVTVAAISDGIVTGGGNGSHYAIIDSANSRLLAAGAMAQTKTVAVGSPFTTTAFDIGIPGPA